MRFGQIAVPGGGRRRCAAPFGLDSARGSCPERPLKAKPRPRGCFGKRPRGASVAGPSARATHKGSNCLGYSASVECDQVESWARTLSDFRFMLTAVRTRSAWIGKPYSSDLRQRFVAAPDEGMSPARPGAGCASRDPRRSGGPRPGSARGEPGRCRGAGTAGLKRVRHMRRRSQAGLRRSPTFT